MPPSPVTSQEIAPGVRLLARMSDLRIKESSGVVASRRFPNVFWTHNDGGGPKKQVLYAIDRQGKTLASFPVTGATFHDWEDIAIDDAGHLYLGDIGNNDSKRDTLAVYEIDEPDPASACRFRFPETRVDAEVSRRAVRLRKPLHLEGLRLRHLEGVR